MRHRYTLATVAVTLLAAWGTQGLRGHLSVRLQPNHPTDDPLGVTASVLDGLLHGSGDAVIGINPATDSPAQTTSTSTEFGTSSRKATNRWSPPPVPASRRCSGTVTLPSP